MLRGGFYRHNARIVKKWAHKMNPYTHEFEYAYCPSCGAEMLTDADAGEIANCIEFKRRMKR